MINIPTVELNGVTLDFDWEDADLRERYLDAAELMQRQMHNLDEKHDESNDPRDEIMYIKQGCVYIRTLLDSVFGDGTGDAVFKGRNSLKICRDVVDAFFDSITLQEAESETWTATSNIKFNQSEGEK